VAARFAVAFAGTSLLPRVGIRRYARVMTVLHVPYHLDEHHADLNIPLPADADVQEVTVKLPAGEVWTRLVHLYDRVADTVASQVRTGATAVVVSGDCTMSIGMATGLQRAGLDPAIVWIDAHGDVHTLETTESGYLGGMALRFLLGYRPDLIAEPLGLRPSAPERVLLLDARDLDSAEVDYLKAAPLGHRTLVELSPDDLPDGPLLLNLDLDTLDPAVLSGLRYPAAHGPGESDLLRAVRTIVDSGRVAAVNLACTWHAGSPPNRTRERLIASVLKAISDPRDSAEFLEGS
jgi:arginase